MNMGTITRSPISFCVLAVDTTPRCWMAKTISMMTAPMKNATFSETAGKNGKSKLTSDQDCRAGVLAEAITRPRHSEKLSVDYPTLKRLLLEQVEK